MFEKALHSPRIMRFLRQIFTVIHHPALLTNVIHKAPLQLARLASTSFRSSSALPSPAAINTEENNDTLNRFFKKVNDAIEESQVQRNFAIVHIYGQQHLVKEGDIIILRKLVPIEMGEKMKFEKCLAAGNANITLIGRPLLNRDLVHVEASVIEKTMTQTSSNMRWKRRSQMWRKWYFKRYPLTMLRINEVKICHKLNESQKEIQ